MIILEKPVVEAWGPSPSGVEENMKVIERAGRVCYQSQDKITDFSAEPFCKMLCDRGHTAMIEFSWLAVRVTGLYIPAGVGESKFLFHVRDDQTCAEFIVGNYRAWIEVIQKMSFHPVTAFSLLTDLPGCVERLSNSFEIIPNEELPARFQNFIFRFVVDRAVTHELVRHRPASPAQRSQRYCAPPKEQRYADFHPKTVEFLLPWWLEGKRDSESYALWQQAMMVAEYNYYHLLETHSPQEARSVLPNSTAAEIVIASPVWHWVDTIFPLRTAGAAYPEMRRVMKEAEVQLLEYFDSEDLA